MEEFSNSYRLKNPHDVFFKESLSNKKIAGDIILNYCSKEITEQIDMRTLKRTNDTFVDKELSTHLSDMIYTATIKGNTSYIYFLFEHKSYPDKLVAFQILRNMVKIWENCLKQNKKIKKLPFILPILFYHGKKRWTEGCKFINIIEDISFSEVYIPDFSFDMLDISHLNDDEVRGDILTKIVIDIFRYILSDDPVDKIINSLNMLSELKDEKEATRFLETILRYITVGIEQKDASSEKRVKEKIRKALKEGDSIMATMAERWLKEGEAKGISIGMSKGIIEGKIEDIGKMIEEKFEWNVIQKITGISKKEYLQHKNKSKR